MEVCSQAIPRAKLRRKVDLPPDCILSLSELEALLEAFKNYHLRKGLKPRSVRFMKHRKYDFIKALPVIRKFDVSAEQYLEILEKRFSEISGREIILSPGHLSSIHADAYLKEALEQNAGHSLFQIERAAKLRADQKKYLKYEDDSQFEGLHQKIKSGTATPWEFFYFKHRIAQVLGEIPKWVLSAQDKLKVDHHEASKK